MFTEEFGSYVCVDDTITCEVGGFTVTARVEHDPDAGPPDENNDGFWPSLDPDSAGYIGPRSKSTLAREKAYATRVMEAWKNDEWHYVGVVLTVEREGVSLVDGYRHALWGIESNYPPRPGKKMENGYLTEVANQLLADALDDARATVKKLCACVE